MDNSRVFLNIGCGKRKLNGFINIDIEGEADIQVDVTKGLPFENNSVHRIFNEHFIEHLTQAEGIAFLRECRRVLVDQGRLRIATPDLDYIVRRYQSEDWRKESGEWIRYGYDWVATRAEQMNLAMREWGHRWLYNEEELVRLALAAGLSAGGRCAYGASEDPVLRGLEYREGSRLICEFVKDRSLPESKSPLVSIVIPAFNPRYFRQAIESALGQTYRNVEIVVCDDRPDEEIGTIAADYAADSRLRYQKNPHNLGSKQNLIEGFHRSRGEYIKYLNDDDLLHPECVARMVACLSQWPDVTLVTSHRQCIDRDGNHLDDIKETKRPYASDVLIDGVHLADTMLMTGTNFIGEPTTVMFRKKDLEASRPNMISFAERECIAIADQTMWVNLLSRGDAIYLVDTLSYFRLHSEQGQRQPSFMPKIVPAIDQLRFDAKRMGFLSGQRLTRAVVRPLEPKAPQFGNNAVDSTGAFACQDIAGMTSTNSGLRGSSVRMIAFYLPQYHPIPENDAWWGEGFTEWTNVKKAVPRFEGHYQPHRPGELGYYDLRDGKVRRAQADLAAQHGISGFCYYHYWFNGKRLLNRPLDEVLASGEPDFPFCLCWANENWTRVWDGQEKDVLMRQHYGDEDDKEHIRFLSGVFRDSRYIRVEGKPLFLVYRANRLPDPLRTATLWREEARRLGIGELYLCRVESFPDEHRDPRAIGFDASVEFQPDWTRLPDRLIGAEYADHAVFRYEELVERMHAKEAPGYKRFPCVTPGFDNSPRRKSNAYVFTDSSPELYEKWLGQAIAKTESEQGERLVFINAWNEWGEGNHLEPDQKYGRSYLEATKRVLDKYNNKRISNVSPTKRNEIQLSACEEQDNSTGQFKYMASIIIAVYNKREYTKQCLESLIISNIQSSFELIIIDNASTDGTAEYLQKLSGDVKIISNTENLGFTLAVNQGAALAEGKYLILLNNDTSPQSGWLDRLVALAESDSAVGAVGAKLVYPNGALQEAGALIFSDGTGWNFGKGDDPLLPRYNAICEVDYCSGACLLVRHDLFKKLGGLDVRYAPAYYEDTDLCFGLRKLGAKVLYNPEAVVIHHESVTAGKDYANGFRRYQEVNRQKFVEKWKMELAAQEGPPQDSSSIPQTCDRKRLGDRCSMRSASAMSAEREDVSRVTVLVFTDGHLGGLRSTLAALRSMRTQVPVQVMVLDMSSRGEVATLLDREQEMLGSVTRWSASRDDGPSICSQIVQAAPSDFIVLLEGGSVPRAGWLDALLATAEAHEGVGAVCSRRILANGRLAEAGGIVFSNGALWPYGRGDHAGHPRFDYVREVDYGSLSGLLIRKEALTRIGGVGDWLFRGGYGAADLAFSLRQAGYRVLYQPESVVQQVSRESEIAALSAASPAPGASWQKDFVEKWEAALQGQHPADPQRVSVARNRASGMRILVIDPFLPVYDRASGSRRLFEMLRILMSLGHAVTFIARDGRNQDKYAAELRQMGIEVYATDPEMMGKLGYGVAAPPIDLSGMLTECRFDVAILSFYTIAQQYLPVIRLHSPGTRIVIDTVDVHFLREMRQAELQADEGLRRRAAETQKQELAVYRQADALITVSTEDKDHLVSELPEAVVHVVPNIHEIDPVARSFSDRQGLLFVGNFLHTPNTDAVLFFCKEILPAVHRHLPEVVLTIVGNAPPPEVQALASDRVKVTGYVPSTAPYLQSHRISVAPLRYGAGMKGKIGEALAAGLPVVTTAIGAEGFELPEDGGIFLVAEDAVTFANEVVRLYRDESLWRSLSSAGRMHIQQHFGPEAARLKLQSLLGPSSAPRLSAPVTSIIMLTLNQLNLTKDCLASIEAHTPEPYEIIVVDNGSSDGTVDYLRSYAAAHANVRLITNSENLGFAMGNNQGLAVAKGDYVLLLNNDTVVTPGWLGRMLDVCRRNPATGIVGPMSNYVSGPQLVTGVTYRDGAELVAFAEQWAEAHRGQSQPIMRVVGFCLLARRAVIDAIGGLDVRFPSGNFEDDDFCVRAALAGFEARIAKDVFIHHVGSQTFIGAKIDYSHNMERNWKLFKEKWRIPAESPMGKGYRLPPRDNVDPEELFIPLPEVAEEIPSAGAVSM